MKSVLYVSPDPTQRFVFLSKHHQARGLRGGFRILKRKEKRRSGR